MLYKNDVITLLLLLCKGIIFHVGWEKKFVYACCGTNSLRMLLSLTLQQRCKIELWRGFG